jgi:thiamine-phosphate pyrophosphorylase
MIRVRFRRSADLAPPSQPVCSTGLPFNPIVALASCQTEGVSERNQRIARARLYLVCDAQPDTFLNAALDGGVDIVQLRCKSAGDAEILSTAKRFAAICGERDALFIVNDRPDLAVSAGADGVHLGQDDMPVQQARALVGEDGVVGLSTHTRAQIDAARELPVDYIAVGPVHETPTKPGRPAVGLELVAYAAAQAAPPFFAIGGIDPVNVGSVAAAGAERVVVVRALTQARDPEQAARRLRAGLAQARERVGSAQS